MSHSLINIFSRFTRIPSDFFHYLLGNRYTRKNRKTKTAVKRVHKFTTLPPEIILHILLFDSDLKAYHSLLGVVPKYQNIEIMLLAKFAKKQRADFYVENFVGQEELLIGNSFRPNKLMQNRLITDIENEVAIRYHDIGYVGLTREMFIGLEVNPIYSICTYTSDPRESPFEEYRIEFYIVNGAKSIGGSASDSVLISFSKAKKGSPDLDCKMSIYNLAGGFPRLETRCNIGNIPRSVCMSSNGWFICMKYDYQIIVYDRQNKKNEKRFNLVGLQIFNYSTEGVGNVEISNDGQVLIVHHLNPCQLKLINVRTGEEIHIPLPSSGYRMKVYGDMIISVYPSDYLEKAPSEGFIIDMASSLDGCTLWERCKALSQKRIIFPIHQPIPLSIQGLYLGHINGEFALTNIYTTMPQSLSTSNTVNVCDMSSTVRLTNLKIMDQELLIWTLSPDTTRMAIAYRGSYKTSWIALVNLEPEVLKTFRFDPSKTTNSTLQFCNIRGDLFSYITSMQFVENDRLLVVSFGAVTIYEIGSTVKRCSKYDLKLEGTYTAGDDFRGREGLL